MCLDIRPGHLQSGKLAPVLGDLVYPLNTSQVHHCLDAVNHLRGPSKIWKGYDGRSRVDGKVGRAQTRAVRASPSFHLP